MHALDITVTLDTLDDTAFAAHSLGVAARLAAWPGMVCAGVRTDPSRRTLSGRYLATGRTRSRGFSTDALELSLRGEPAVSEVRFGDANSTDAVATSAPTRLSSRPSLGASYRTARLPRFEHAA